MVTSLAWRASRAPELDRVDAFSPWKKHNQSQVLSEPKSHHAYTRRKPTHLPSGQSAAGTTTRPLTHIRAKLGRVLSQKFQSCETLAVRLETLIAKDCGTVRRRAQLFAAQEFFHLTTQKLKRHFAIPSFAVGCLELFLSGMLESLDSLRQPGA